MTWALGGNLDPTVRSWTFVTRDSTVQHQQPNRSGGWATFHSPHYMFPVWHAQESVSR